MTTMDGATSTKSAVVLTQWMEPTCLLMRMVMESVMFLTLIGTMTVFQTPMKPTQASTLIQAIREPIHGIQIPMVTVSVTDRSQS